MKADRFRQRRRIGRLSFGAVFLMTTMTGVGIVRDEKAECSDSRSSATPTRRGVARTIVGATFSAALGPRLGRGPAEAAKNRRRKRNDNKNKKKHKHDDKLQTRPPGRRPTADPVFAVSITA